MADQRVEELRKVPLFSKCSDKQLQFIATQVEVMDFEKGKVLCTEGESGGDFFVILEGQAEVRKDGKVINRMGKGDFFGEIALVDRGPRTATVTVIAPMRSLVLGPSQFTNVLRQDADIAVSVLLGLGSRLRELLH
jgi:CRP/FNR family transcriptional regulator, cyclic AMP receptor protein